jgi:hypothetical protein
MAIHDNAALSYGNALLQSFNQPTPWIWDGLVAEYAVTLLSAPEKTGKTTLLSLLLDRRHQGGQLLGRAVRPGRTILCSEPGDRFSRRRHFTGVGRFPGTLGHVAAELNREGTDYLLVGDGPPEVALTPALETLRQLLSESPAPLTRQEILARWPEGEPRPRADSLWRSLARGCELGILVRTGAGNKAEAFRYGLARGKPGG